MPLRPGDQVEHFVIVAPLGQGGMGQVYVARDTRLQRSVALKIMHTDRGAPGSDQAKSDGAARLMREAQAAAALEHPNVVTVFEVGTVGDEGDEAGSPFIAMELVKGKPLRAFVNDASVPMATRLRWLLDVARALAAAHKAQLVHRDIKPENVMVRDDGAVKVLDFGLAKRAASPAMSSTTSTEAQVLPSLTGKGVAVGTPYYMAPEQMRREPLDGRADQFAWAVMAYELLSGIPPWGKEIDALELVSKLLTEMPPPLATVNAEVPPHVSAAVARAMAKSRGDRFASMDELIAAIDEGLVSSTSAAPPRVSVKPASLDGGDAGAVAPHAATVEVVSAPPARRAKRPGWIRVAGAAAALAGIAGGAWGIGALGKRGGVAPAPSGSAGLMSDGAPAECSTRKECTAKLGQPAVCHAGKCAALASEDCEVKADPVALESEDTVWFGTMFPKGDPDFDAELRAVDLARLDFVQMMSGFAGRGAESSVPPLGLVSCDDRVNEERAARHLVEDVHVPAVIGLRSAAEVVKIGSQFLIPNDVVGIISLCTSPLATALPTRPNQPRLIWRTTYTSVEAAKVLGHLVSDVVEPQRRAAPGPHRDTRVVYIRGKVLGGTTFDELLFMALRFNGQSAMENGSKYRQIVIDDHGPTVREDLSAVVKSIVEFSPDVIITMMSQAATVAAIEGIEASWPTRARHPHYVTSSPLLDEDAARVGRWPEARARSLSIAPVTSTSVNARFVLHFNESAPLKVTRELAPNSDYDSFYLLAYATYATNERPISGPSLARSIGRLLPPGKAVDVGPAGIFDAYSLLHRGENIDLNGAFGSLDFDVTTGEVPFDYAVVCLSGEPLTSIESGLVFHSSDARFQGVMHCP